MANAFVKFNSFVEDNSSKLFDLTTGTTDTFKVMLSNVLPVATDSVLLDITEIAAGDGYTAGGNAAAFTSGVQTAGVFKLILADPAQWIAAAGTFATFRYVVLYCDSATADPLLGWYDYGSALSLGVDEKFDADLDQANGVLTLT